MHLSHKEEKTQRHREEKVEKRERRKEGRHAFSLLSVFSSLCLCGSIFFIPYRSPASSCSSRQFSSRSCLAISSVSDGRPSRSKCLENRPSLRAKSMNVTSSFVFGLTNQSPLTFGLPCNDSRCLTVSPARGS